MKGAVADPGGGHRGHKPAKAKKFVKKFRLSEF